MKCKDVQERLLDYAESLVDPKTAAQIEAHLRSCATCAQELTAFKETVHLLQSVQFQEPPEAFWNDFTRNVMRNVRIAERNAPQRMFAFFPSFKPVMALATVLILVAAGIFFSSTEIGQRLFRTSPAVEQVAQTEPPKTVSEIGHSALVLEQIVSPEIVQEMLETEWALVDGQSMGLLDVDTSDEMVDVLLESLTEQEKISLFEELEQMK